VGISISLVLAAAGAELIWAVGSTSSGFGFVASPSFWTSCSGFGRCTTEAGGDNTTALVER
jgi:hypothetical protein